MKDYLKKIKIYRLRDTLQRQEIYKFIKKTKYPLSANDIHKHLKWIDLATIHRTLKTFEKIELIELNNFIKETKKYSIKSKKHQHIIVCKYCGKTILLDFCLLKFFESKIQKKTGFNILEHQLQFLGICNNCKDKTCT